MKYTLEIEEKERTLVFQLDIECKYQYTPAMLNGPWEDCYPEETDFDIISVAIDWVELFNEDGFSETFKTGSEFEAIEKKYRCFIENILDEDETLQDTWIKYLKEV